MVVSTFLRGIAVVVAFLFIAYGYSCSSPKAERGTIPEPPASGNVHRSNEFMRPETDTNREPSTGGAPAGYSYDNLSPKQKQKVQAQIQAEQTIHQSRHNATVLNIVD